MVKILSEEDISATVVALEKGSTFYSLGLVPEGVEQLVRVDSIVTGENRLIAKQDILVVVEGLWHNPCTGADHIVFIRNDRTNEAVGSLWFAKPQYRPQLRNALIAANVSPVEVIGGFNRVLVYGDEIAVPESGFGFCGWIIKRDDIEKYLKAAQGKESPHTLGRITIRHEIHLDAHAEKFSVVRVEGWSEPPMVDDVTLWSVTEYVVLFDKESRIVQAITVTNGDVVGLSCDRSPIRSIAIGKRLPNNLGLK